MKKNQHAISEAQLQRQQTRRRKRIAAALVPSTASAPAGSSSDCNPDPDDLLDLTEEELVAEYLKSPEYLRAQKGKTGDASVPPSAGQTRVSNNASTSQLPKLVAKASFPCPADPTEKAKEEALATLTLKSSVNAAIVVEQFSKKIIPGVSLGVLQEELSGCLRKVAAGDMKQAETMLMGQAIALQSIFLHMARLVPGQEFVSNKQTFLGMALKAQNQCRMTLETLNELKNPRQVAFVRADQANVSHGHQQVNNQTASRVEKPGTGPNELLEQTHGERLEQRTAPAAELDDPQMAAVGSLDRS